ncbi:MAG: choice-of-anchor D domain-containing protein [Bradymonadaceae bacterium]
MKRWNYVVAALFVAVGMGALVAACGGNSFQDEEAPIFNIEGITSGQFLLDFNLRPGRHNSLGETVILRNSGLGDLQVTKLKWVSAPERLVVNAGNMDQSCATDAECGEQGACIIESGSCRQIVFPQTPFTIRPSERRDFGFLILDGAGEVICPEPHAEVPEHFQSRYCGEWLIETNAGNTGGIVEEGKARIYFLTDGNSGRLELEPQLIQFPGATGGATQSRTVTLKNSASTPLHIERFDIYQNPQVFEFSRAGDFPMTIEANGESTHTLTYRPPAGASESELEYSTRMVFTSSSTGLSAQELLIEVTQSTGDRPLIEVDPLALSFEEETTQIITVRNLGNATLLLNGATFRPHDIRPYYKLFYNGNDITGSFPQGNDAPRLERVQNEEIRSLELEVRFTPPDDAETSTVGTLELTHNDSATGPVQVTLMGDAGEAPIGEVVPNFVTFSVRGGENTRHVVAYNRGTQPLTITNVDIQPAANVDASDFAVVGLTVIPPGGLLTGAISFEGTTGAAATFKSAVVVVESDSVGNIGDMTFTVSAMVAEPPTIEPSITPSFATNAKVGESTTFTVGVESGNANLPNTVWALHGRPAGSDLLFRGTGGQVSFTPDVAGAYKLSAIVPDTDGQEVQTILEFNAVD